MLKFFYYCTDQNRNYQQLFDLNVFEHESDKVGSYSTQSYQPRTKFDVSENRCCTIEPLA